MLYILAYLLEGSVLFAQWPTAQEKKLHMVTVVLLWGGFASDVLVAWCISFHPEKTGDIWWQTARCQPSAGRMAWDLYQSERASEIYLMANSINKINARGRPNWIFPRHWRGIPRSVKPLWAQQLLFWYISKWQQLSAPLSQMVACDFWRDAAAGNQGLEISVDTCGHRPEKFEPREKLSQ